MRALLPTGVSCIDIFVDTDTLAWGDISGVRVLPLFAVGMKTMRMHSVEDVLCVKSKSVYKIPCFLHGRQGTHSCTLSIKCAEIITNA